MVYGMRRAAFFIADHTIDTSTLKGSFSARHESTGGEKKPLNPVLGETFHGSWTTSDGETTLTAEQVSHHPPVSAYRIKSPVGIVLQGHNGQKSGFSGRTIVVRQVGQAVLTVPTTLSTSETETYLITLPQLTLEGLFFGSPYAELAEQSYIVSSSGWIAMNEYSGKGWLSGEKNTIKTSIYAPGHFTETGHAKYVVEGQWIDRLRMRTRTAKYEKDEVFLDTHKEERIQITPQETTDPYESRKLWHGVARALHDRDYEAASRLKGEIEQAQRNLRKSETEQGRTWKRKYFEWKQEIGTVLQGLMEKVGHVATGGDWQYKDSA